MAEQTQSRNGTAWLDQLDVLYAKVLEGRDADDKFHRDEPGGRSSLDERALLIEESDFYDTVIDNWPAISAALRSLRSEKG